jgi:FlaA1/EpsC-like NDP-sugar epimerase
MSPHIRRLVLRRLAKFFDLVIVSFTFLVVMATTTGDGTWTNVAHVFAMRIAVGNFVAFALYLGFCSLVFTGCGLYRSHRLSVVGRRAREILLAATLITAIILALRNPLDLSFAKNDFLLLFWLLVFASLTLSHEVALHLLQYARVRGRNLRHIVIVGERQEAAALAERIAKDATLGYRVVGVIHPGDSTQ